jgi:glycosyltransferase involved in cell wall biosynthesis
VNHVCAVEGNRRPRVVHSLGWYFPESSGGTEVYVDALARHLTSEGVESQVVAATDSFASDYVWGDVPVHRYAVPPATSQEVTDALPHERFAEFDTWLRSQRADIYHQHSWTRGCGLPHLTLAKELGFKTVLTVHVPNVICLRGTMMLDGERACDGKIDLERCTQCWGTSKGVPRFVGNWQARNPSTSETLGSLLPNSRLQTALLLPRFVARRQQELKRIADVADRVVAVCRWLYDALLLNGFPREKLVYCAQGIEAQQGFQPRVKNEPANRPFRIGYLGRWDPVKGVHILVEAFRQLSPSIDAELIVHALPGDHVYEQSVRSRAEGISRIRIAEPLTRHEIFPALAGFDLLAVPSLWLETGPLVVLEAFAAGTPVLGADLGGIAELVRPGVNGWLVRPDDAEAWCRAIADHVPSARLHRVSSQPRSSSDVAQETGRLYQGLTGAPLTIPSSRSSWAQSAF